jgi:hypothetical protein
VADSSAAFLERRAGYRAERNYLGHIHDAAVYTGLVPQGSLYLLSSHAMQAARLYRHGDGRTVHVNANPAADAPSQCDLTVQWRLGVTKSSEPVWQLPYEAGDAPVR